MAPWTPGRVRVLNPCHRGSSIRNAAHLAGKVLFDRVMIEEFLPKHAVHDCRRKARPLVAQRFVLSRRRFSVIRNLADTRASQNCILNNDPAKLLLNNTLEDNKQHKWCVIRAHGMLIPPKTRSRTKKSDKNSDQRTPAGKLCCTHDTSIVVFRHLVTHSQ